MESSTIVSNYRPKFYKNNRERRLSNEEINEYQSIFNILDINKDGIISFDEIGIALRAIGIIPTDKDIEEMMKIMDKNQNGVIEFNEFISLMSKMEDPDSNEIKKMFREFDTDESGGLSIPELRNGIAYLKIGITNREMDEMFRDVKTNDKGEITYEDFVTMILES